PDLAPVPSLTHFLSQPTSSTTSNSANYSQPSSSALLTIFSSNIVELSTSESTIYVVQHDKNHHREVDKSSNLRFSTSLFFSSHCIYWNL
ncbi:hypothetical protein LINPERHAP1_LOCUS31530, partial [Linum perenne]